MILSKEEKWDVYILNLAIFVFNWNTGKKHLSYRTKAAIKKK